MKKRYIFLIILFVIILISIGIFIIIDIQKEKQEDAVAVTFNDDLTVEFDTNVKVSEFIKELQGELIDDFYVNTESLGSQTVTFQYKSIRNKKKTRTFNINVVDTVKPLIYMGNTVTVTKGYDKDLINLIFSGDNADPKPERQIIGDYDVNTVGDYKLTFNIKDQSGNEQSQDFTLKVVNAKNGTGTAPVTASKIDFNEAITRYKNDNTRIGIDVSQWQGDVDWQKVKQAGAEFAIIRIGYQKDYDAEYVLDPCFEKNIKGAQEAGLDIGIYFYSYAKRVQEAEEQANWVADNLKDYNISLPIAFDWESWTSFVKCDISFHDINKLAKTFVDTLENKGYKGSVYGSKNYLQKVWYEDRFENIWLAHYTKETDYENKYYMWQFCNTGKIDGINGDVDIDVLYK